MGGPDSTHFSLCGPDIEAGHITNALEPRAFSSLGLSSYGGNDFRGVSGSLLRHTLPSLWPSPSQQYALTWFGTPSTPLPLPPVKRLYSPKGDHLRQLWLCVGGQSLRVCNSRTLWGKWQGRKRTYKAAVNLTVRFQLSRKEAKFSVLPQKKQ